MVAVPGLVHNEHNVGSGGGSEVDLVPEHHLKAL